MSIRIGYIGAGNICRAHMQASKKLDVTMYGVFDVIHAAAEAVAKEYGIARHYDDLGKMLGDADLDAVVVGTPNKFHAEHAIACLEAGKHVLLEKPMAMNAVECDQIIRAKQKSGKVLLMGMLNRYKASSGAIKQVIDSGACGQIYSGQTYWFRRRGIPGFGSWFTTKSMAGGGGMIDIGVHMLDLALYFMGFPKAVAVSGMTYNVWDKLENYKYTGMWGKPVPGSTKDVDDYALALVRFADGQSLNLNVSWALNMETLQVEQGVRLMGTQGGVAMNGLDNPWFFGEQFGLITDTKISYAQNDPFVDEQKHFLDCCAGSADPLSTAEQGRVVQSILDGIYESSTQNREVRLDG